MTRLEMIATERKHGKTQKSHPGTGLPLRDGKVYRQTDRPAALKDYSKLPFNTALSSHGPANISPGLISQRASV